MATQCPKCKADNPDTQSFCGDCGTRLDPSKDFPSVTKTLETPAKKLAVGMIFADRYEILEELGKGGMGEVYKVRDKKLDEDMALKLLRPEISLEKSTLERFRNELKLARKISHMNVCRMFDFHEEEGTPYITMEYVPGEDLKNLIKKKGKLSKEEVLDIAKQMCEGLDVAHKLGVVHRDLKPQNIMIDESGNAKVMDFGIARSVGAEGVTEAGMIIGTPDYISPEQADGEAADHRSDIYSLGVILYEMVTGTVPFKGDTALSVALKHKSQFPLDPRKLNPDVSDDLNRLILICMEKDRDRRYQTAEALLNDLRNIEEGLPLGTRIQPRRATLVQTLIRKRLFIPAMAIVLAFIAVAIWQLLPQGEMVSLPKIENSLAIISFENQTGDEAFNQLRKIIPNLLITNLENTGFFYVATWERMKDLLKQMDKGDVDIITRDQGFQACQREGIQALVLGSFAKVGDTFVTDVKVLDVETKRLLNSASSRGEGEGSIFAQIDELSKEISEGLGLSQQKIEAAPSNISKVTTSSMEAYKYFIKGKEDRERYYGREAKESLEKAVKLDPEFAMAWLYLGYCMDQREDKIEAYKKALAFSEKATERERLYIKASYVAVVDGDMEKELNIYREIATKYPNEKRAHFMLGLRSQNKGNLEGAIEEYDKALALDPNYGSVLNQIAMAYFGLRNKEKTIEYFERYVAVDPQNANAFDSYGGILFYLGAIEEAAVKYIKALEVKPDWISSYQALSYFSALEENYSEAIKWADLCIDKAPDTGVGYLIRGFYYLWLGRMDEALKEIQTAALLTDSEMYKAIAGFMEGLVYVEKDEYELARESLKTWVSYLEKNQSTLRAKLAENIWLGKYELKGGRIDSVKARLAEIESLTPEAGWFSKPFYTGLHDSLQVEVHLAEGRLEETVKLGKKLFCPVWLGIYQQAGVNMYVDKDVLARTYLQKGELDKAISEYERLMTFDPESRDRLLIHPKYHYRLAKLYEEKGRKDKAIDQYEIFLDLWRDADPGYDEVGDARQRLERLR